MDPKIITSDDILGKDVVDIDGEILGVVQQLRINKDSKKIVGILMDQGFGKPDMFIGLDNIKNFGVDSVFLSKSPRPKLKGIDVYDKLGKKIGSVMEVIEQNNTIKGIIIKKGQIGKKFLIMGKYIKIIGYNIILKVREPKLEMKQIKGSVKSEDLIKNAQKSD